jgi:hypothetical protein
VNLKKWTNNLAYENSISYISGLSLWGYMKADVCIQKIRDPHCLRERIYAAVVTVTLVMLHHNWNKIKYRLEYLPGYR